MWGERFKNSELLAQSVDQIKKVIRIGFFKCRVWKVCLHRM